MNFARSAASIRRLEADRTTSRAPYRRDRAFCSPCQRLPLYDEGICDSARMGARKANGQESRFVAVPRWADVGLTIGAGLSLFAAALGVVLAVAAAGDASLPEALRFGGGVLVCLLMFAISAVYSTWWRSRLDRWLTTRPAER